MQVDQSREHQNNGLGVGLHLVKILVEMHSGSVEVRSEGIDQGSEFIVHLPLYVTGQTSPQPSATLALESIKSTTCRVLIADDNLDALDSFSMLLKQMGHEVDIARDGYEAIEKAAIFQPTIIFLDINMPRLNGYEAAIQIRKHQRNNTILVAMTGWSQEKDLQLSREAGFDHHLAKPVDLDILTKLLSASC